MKKVNQKEIENALRDLGLEGKDIAVHSSLRSFGHAVGGAQAVVDAFINVCSTILMPSFCELGRTNPPQDDRPIQNGWDYNGYTRDSDGLIPFDPSTFNANSEINIAEMGNIPAAFLKTKDTKRSKHPSVSWAAHGPFAEWYVSGHEANNPNYPLKKLLEKQGFVILVGVGLSECTAIHLAEEIAGRRAFIRWVLFADGTIHRVREYGCSDGFNNLLPYLEDNANKLTIGECSVMSFPIKTLIDATVDIIKANPKITLCGQQTLCRCQDSVKGGPIE